MSAPDVILDVRGVSKFYARTAGRADSVLMRDLPRAVLGLSSKPHPAGKSDIVAVDDLDLMIRRGEAVGIIGLNGSGKTTTLRMVAGQLRPDRGEIVINGRSAAIIALAAGMEGGETGRSNIYIRSAMMGRSRKDVESVADEIIEFTELGEAIDSPIATYSSGMKIRLAFAIAIFTRPDLLIVDETLSVGDFHFRQKCLSKVRELRENSAFLLVTHSMGDVRNFCDRVLVMHRGKVVFEGEPLAAVEYYQRLGEKGRDEDAVAKVARLRGDFIRNDNEVSDVEHHWCDAQGNMIDRLDPGEDAYFRAAFTLRDTPIKPQIGIPIWSREGVYVTGISTLHSDEPVTLTAGRNEFIIKVPGFPLNPGRYESNFSINDSGAFLYRQPNEPVVVRSKPKMFWGVIHLAQQWRRVNHD
ncbi:ABC transporter ATP-binding protein [Glycocaulis profundi]|nr:ABC transporter ATP-binding protein [Glycocaulis profundi]